MIVNVIGGTLSQKEVDAYKLHVKKKLPNEASITELTIKLDESDPEYVDLEYKYDMDVPFERIRRISGYLGTIPRINNAKQHEIAERLKHGVNQYKV